MTRFVKDAKVNQMRKWARSAKSADDRFDAVHAVFDHDHAVRNPNATEAEKSCHMNRFAATFKRLQKKYATPGEES